MLRKTLHVSDDFFLAAHISDWQFPEMRVISLILLLVTPMLAEGQASIDAKTASKMIDGCVAHWRFSTAQMDAEAAVKAAGLTVSRKR